MEAIILIGIQASGKSTFYKENFFNSHVRISNDLLKTKNRERKLIEYCNENKMSFVIDNTNITKAIRLSYINKIKQINYKIKGYYFESNLEQALEWNKKRIGKDIVPDIGILGFCKKLEIPSLDEGFDELYYVEAIKGEFIIKEWKDEI